jgi:hypothetical protein
VTRLALRPEAAFVYVIFAMATVARFRRFTIFFVGRMTAFAFHRFVRAIQTIFRQAIVLEARFVELYDVCRAALMVGVASATSGALLLAVHAALLLQIDVNIFVTINAQTILRIFVERYMAALALFFNFRVTTNHLSRHQCRFQALRARSATERD